MNLPEFTSDGYRALVKAFIDKDFQFLGFSEAQSMKSDQAYVLLRHDIDYDVLQALKIAKIESDLGVKSTFFFLITTRNYNIFCKEEQAWINQIIKMGHEIALHFDAREYPQASTMTEINNLMEIECKMIESFYGQQIKVISFHNPLPNMLQGGAELAKPRIHTYLPQFMKDILYLSDSGAQWRFGHPLESASYLQKKPIQILTHPIWWDDQPADPKKVLKKYVSVRDDDFRKLIAQNCKSVTLEDLQR